jgi:hypothetical protein
MIEVRVAAKSSPGLCYFCWRQVSEPQSVPTEVYEHGRLYVGAVACARCLWLAEPLLRGEMLARARAVEEVAADEEQREMAAELRDDAVGRIVRPPTDVLELELLYRLVGGVSQTRI